MLHFIQKFSQVSSKESLLLRLGTIWSARDQTTCKILKSPFTVRRRFSIRTDTLCLKTCLQKYAPPLFPRHWLLSPYPLFASKIQNYHTSPCNFKKQKQPVSPTRPPSSITYLPDSPKPALYLTLAGLIPFVAPPLVMAITKSYIPVLAFTQMAYGASFLSFLGGVRWGFALTEGSPAKPDYLNLANSATPLLFSWFAFLVSDKLNEAIVFVIIGLGIALHLELFLLPHYPNWFKALRILVTLVAVFSFIITLLLKDIYPEKGPKRPTHVR